MIAIMLPTYNEAENIEKIIPEIDKHMKNYHYMIYIIDDDSPDGTAIKALELSEKYPVKVILRYREEKDIEHPNLIKIPLNRRGLSMAVIEGFKIINADAYIVMDADGQHPPEFLPKMVEKLDECDLVIGSRYIPGAKIENWTWWRLIISKVFTVFVHMILPQLRNINDVNSGFFAARRDVVQRGLDYYDGYGFKILWEVIVKGRPKKVCEIPIVFRNRMAGHSKAGLKVGIEGLISAIKLRGWKPSE